MTLVLPDLPDTVRVEIAGSAATITLTNPDQLNAVDGPMLDGVIAALEALAAAPEVRVIALTGAGRGFCSGAGLPDDGEGDLAPTLYAGGRLVSALLACPTPTVALVNGVAAGIGVPIAVACDYLLASEAASFVLAFAKIALVPDGGSTALLAASIGRTRAMRLALTGEKLPARTAAEWGLVSECVPAEEFPQRSAEVVAQLAGSAPLGVAATTRAINAATLDLEPVLAREEADQVRLLASADFREGVDAFRGRRSPEFRGA